MGLGPGNQVLSSSEHLLPHARTQLQHVTGTQSGWGGVGAGTLQGPKQGSQAQPALMAINEGNLGQTELVTKGHRSCTLTSPKQMDKAAQWQGPVLSNKEDAEKFWCVTPGRETDRKVTWAMWDSAQTNTRVPVSASGARAALGACETWAWATWQREPLWQWQWWWCCWPWCHQHCGTLHSHRDTALSPAATALTHTHTCFKAHAWLHAQWASEYSRQPLGWLKAQEVQVRP